MKNFAKRLKELRQENNFTQRAIAEKLNISHIAYLHYEQGKTEPSINAIITLCKLYQVSADYLLGLSDEP